MKGIYIQFNAIIPLAIRNILKNWGFFDTSQKFAHRC